MLKTLEFNGKILKNYRINDNGEIFQGRFNRKINFFIKNNCFYFNLIIGDKKVIVNAIELILSNFKEKPTHGEFEAVLNHAQFDTAFPFRVNNLSWRKKEVSMKSKIESIDPNSLKGMKPVFVEGIAIGLLASKTGKIYDLQGKEKKIAHNRFGEPILEINMPFELPRSKRRLVEIISECYLLPFKDRIENYHFSYVDKNKKNCSVENIIMWKEGSAGIAIKKTVRVFKNGKFFAIFDSVSTCAQIINIPRRTISNMLKSDFSEKQGFKIQEIKLF